MSFTLAIVGRPNVGKSTLFNRLVGKKLALVDDTPGVTRDRREGDARLGDIHFKIIDTAGFEDASGDVLPARMRRQTEAAIAAADVCLFLVDARAGIMPLDEEIARINANRGQPEYLLAEIFLAVDDPAQDEEIRRSAQRLIDQLQTGARFQDLARQFSQSATAPVGGDLGWVSDSQLPDELSDTLSRMSPGQIDGPVRSLAGYHVIFFRRERRIEAGEEWLGLKQVFMPVPKEADAEATALVRSQAAEMAGTLNGCTSMDAKAEELGGASGDLGEVRVGDLPTNLRNAVANLEIGQASQPIQRDDGFVVAAE